MKYLVDVVRLLPELANSKLIWALFMTHAGIKLITILLYLHDWLTKGGLRSDLLLLIDKM